MPNAKLNSGGAGLGREGCDVEIKPEIRAVSPSVPSTRTVRKAADNMSPRRKGDS